MGDTDCPQLTQLAKSMRLESTTERELVITKLMQCKLTLEEKLSTIKRYDHEILELVEDEEVEDEIDQADTFNERMHRAIITKNCCANIGHLLVCIECRCSYVLIGK